MPVTWSSTVAAHGEAPATLADPRVHDSRRGDRGRLLHGEVAEHAIDVDHEVAVGVGADADVAGRVEADDRLIRDHSSGAVVQGRHNRPGPATGVHRQVTTCRGVDHHEVGRHCGRVGGHVPVAGDTDPDVAVRRQTAAQITVAGIDQPERRERLELGGRPDDRSVRQRRELPGGRRRIDRERPRHLAVIRRDADRVRSRLERCPRHDHDGVVAGEDLLGRARRVRGRQRAHLEWAGRAGDRTDSVGGRFGQQRDDRQPGLAGPTAEAPRVGGFGDEPVEARGRAVAGEQRGRARPGDRPVDAREHVERGSGTPLDGARVRVLAVADLLEVVAKHADGVEGAGHPELDVRAGGCGGVRAGGDVAAVPGDVAVSGPPRAAIDLVVRDRAVLRHVPGVVVRSGAPSGNLRHRRQARHGAEVVDGGEPVGVGRDEGRNG